MSCKAIGLVGQPNVGKSALFNWMTGSKAKVANYSGATVEWREGELKDHHTPSNPDHSVLLLDLPGTLTLASHKADEAVTLRCIEQGYPSAFRRAGGDHGEMRLSGLLFVADVAKWERTASLMLEYLARDATSSAAKLPCALVLTQKDHGQRIGKVLSPEKISEALHGIPVAYVSAFKNEGKEEVLKAIDQILKEVHPVPIPDSDLAAWKNSESRFARLEKISKDSTVIEAKALRHSKQIQEWIDRKIFLNKFWGVLAALLVLFLTFQAVFKGAAAPQGWVEDLVAWMQGWVNGNLPEGPIASLIADGIIGGVGASIVFLPQILILFTVIHFLEDSGYLARASFLLDRPMRTFGLSGQGVIPLLSSHACAIPGIMSTRTIPNPRERLRTILVAPLMACSARLPVYTLLIAAFIPNKNVGFGIGLQGLVMMGLYLLGIFSALLISKIFVRADKTATVDPLLIEFPEYRIPSMHGLLSVWKDRVTVFLKRAGTIILVLSMLLWILSSAPRNDDGSSPRIENSYAGKIGLFLEPLFRPLGFPWEVSVALVPGMAAREVMVSALATVYAVQDRTEAATQLDEAVVPPIAETQVAEGVPANTSATVTPTGEAVTTAASKSAEVEESGDEEERVAQALSERIKGQWPLSTAFSLLIWYVFAPQCIATLAVLKRETHSWKWTLFAFGYLFALAYGASYLVRVLTDYFLPDGV